MLRRDGEPGGILDPIMLITGIQSVFELRGELVAANCEILKHFQRFSEDLSVFPRIFACPGLRRTQTSYEKSDDTT